ncbi:DUF6767 domain-containing protein [Austwickia sp. TVS 96-490-7B]|uniref:DUF6767 domain-containing protein n=1 Tax=Austwickia sp. TVS 96-490-7B TaxID=2830843 RepID=UPI00351CC005
MEDHRLMTTADPVRRPVDSRCPLRPGDPCTMCHHHATGPQDCPLVYLVMDDPELRDLYAASRQPSSSRTAASHDSDVVDE